MDKKEAERPAAPREAAAFGGGGAAPSGVGDDGVVGVVGVPDGGVALEPGGVALLLGGVAVEEGGVAVVLPEVTLMASFWPPTQWPVKVQMKKFSPVVLRVILVGGIVNGARVLLVLHES